MAQTVSYLQVLTVGQCQDRLQWADPSLVLARLNLMDSVRVDLVCQILLQTVVLLVIFVGNLHLVGLDPPGHHSHLVQDLTVLVVLMVLPIVVHLGRMDPTNILARVHQDLTTLVLMDQDLDPLMDQWVHMDQCMVHPLISWTDGQCQCCSQTTRSLR